MIVFTKSVTEEKHLVEIIHYKPELLSPEQLSQGIQVDVIPEPETPDGYASTLYYNPITRTFFYEYTELPEDETTSLKRRIEQLERLINHLTADAS